MDADHFLISAAALRTQTALHIAGIAFLVIGLIAEVFVKIFGNWLLFFRRFGTRLFLWLAIGGTSGYLAMFFYAQAEPALRPAFFYWCHSSAKEQTGADWVLLALMWWTGVVGCIGYIVGSMEWVFARGPIDRSNEVAGGSPRFFLLERIAVAGFLLLCLPGFFIIFRSMWAPLSFEDNVLLRYAFLMEKTLDAITFGLLDSFHLHIVNTTGEAHRLSSPEIWVYLILVGVIVVPFLIDIVRYRWGTRAPERTST